MEIRWRNVFILILMIFILFNFHAITSYISGVVSSFASAFGGIFSGHYGGSSNSHIYEIARLCVFLIFVIGILRLLKNWRG